MIITNHALSGTTIVPNVFIDRYMVPANGEYVKLYLFLLRQSSAGAELAADSAAEALECTEKELARALQYWEDRGLLRVERDADGILTAVTLLPPPAEQSATAGPAKSKAGPGNTLTRDRIQALAGQEEVRQLFYIADRYLNRPLSSTEQEELLYYYDTLGFSKDLIIYLLEYCLSKGSSSLHYMRRVALAWNEKKICTVEEARRESALYNKDSYAVMNAFGIRRRSPSPAEQEYISRWLTDLGFSMDVVLEACKRTVLQTHEASFQYADKILEQWNLQKVRSMADILVLDEQRTGGRKKQADSARETQARKAAANRFNQFPQREYDYQELERQLIGAAGETSSGEGKNVDHK